MIPYLAPYTNNGEGTTATTPLNGIAALPEGALVASSDRVKNQGFLKDNAFLYSNPTPVVGAGGQCGPGYETRPSYKSGTPQKLTIGGTTASGSAIYRPVVPNGTAFPEYAPKASTEDSDE